MKFFDWNEEKNRILKEKRIISFEEIVFSIDNGHLLDVLEHHNKSRYPDQGVIIVEIRNYAYAVPFVENENTFFLKTIYPSRKAVKKYLNR